MPVYSFFVLLRTNQDCQLPSSFGNPALRRVGQEALAETSGASFIRESKKEMRRIRDRIKPETVADSIIEAGRQSSTLTLPSPATAAGEGQIGESYLRDLSHYSLSRRASANVLHGSVLFD
jgi:hypothetical protein